ncbi:MAG: hypothetical protein EUB_02608 [Eubacterium sp.]|uniref:recombinase RecT n=1 Tax=Eubacterium sp. TaxID=142586 RepID=UPI00304D8821
MSEEKNGAQEIEKKKSFLDGVVLDGHTFSDYKQYCFAHKMALTFQEASMAPKRYQGNTGDCIIAIDMAWRLNANPLMIMQNLYVVNGMPAWSGQFVIAAINTSKRFAQPLRFKVTGSGDTLSCYAYTKGFDGEEVRGTTITMDMAKKEGWYSKTGSKWQTMPEQMIQYRAASFFGRLYCPDLLMGIYTEDEAMEIENVEYSVVQDKPTPAAVDKEIEQKANKKSLSFNDVEPLNMEPVQAEKEAVETEIKTEPSVNTAEEFSEPPMAEFFDQDELTEEEKAAILEMEAREEDA